MAALTIHLLGPPDVQIDGVPAAIPRRRTRALLFYLAATRRPHTRAHLAERFWGDLPTRVAGRGLSDALYRLRGALSPANPVLAGGDQIALRTGEHCRVDLATFEDRLNTAANGDEQARLRPLEEAVALWRGTLLEGFDLPDCPDFDDWLALERRRLETIYLGALTTLAELYGHAEALDRAITTTLTLLQVDPLREEAHRRLMALHARAGDPAAALKQYAFARALLERELGVAPAPETEALRRRIAAGTYPRSPEQAARSPGSRAVIERRPSLVAAEAALPFVGREPALAMLEDGLGAARSGRGSLVLIAGEAGIGKSRMAAELLARAADVDVLAATCRESTQDLALQPLVEALRPGLSLVEVEALGLPATLRRQIGQLLPELATSGPAEPAVGLPGWERRQLFEALTRVLVALAGRRTLLLLIDDLQWADSTSRQFLAYLGSHIACERILVLCTCRDDALVLLRQPIHELQSAGVLTRIALQRLSAAETSMLVKRLGVATHPARLGGLLYEESAGNPLFIAEMLRNLVERGIVRRGATGRLAQLEEITTLPPLPESLRELIAARLERLSEPARRMLAVAAVAGRELDETLLLRLAGEDESIAVEALEELLQRQLIVETAGGRCRFGHDKIREVAYAVLSEARRTFLHRQVGAALAERGAPPGELAYHFARGRDWPRTYATALAAADAAIAAHANDEAAAQYGLALEAVSQPGGQVGEAELAALLEARGRALLGMSEYAAAIADFVRAAELARGAGDAHRALAATRHLALARFWQHEAAAGPLQLAEAALAEAHRLDEPSEIAACSATLASILVTRGRLREGSARAREALAAGEAAGDLYLVADAGGTLGMASGWRGEFARARAELAASLELASTRRWTLLVPRALFFSGINAAVMGEYDLALDLLGQCRRYADESGDRIWLARWANTVGWVHQELYDLETARRLDSDAVEAARESPWPEPLGNALVNLGLDWVLCGEAGEAATNFARAEALLGRDETMQWRWETRLWLGRGELALLRAGHEAALGYAARALALARTTHSAKNALRARRLQGLAYAAAGRPETALGSLRRAAWLARRLATPRLEREVLLALSAVADRLGRSVEAERYASAAAAIAARIAAGLCDARLREVYLAGLRRSVLI